MNNDLYVITVVMNDEKGFLRTSSSVYSQTKKNFHWIVIDSSREAISTLCEHSDFEGIKANYNWIPPSGIYEAMNHAIVGLTSGWALFLNAGDVFKDENSIKRICEDIASAGDDIGAIGYSVEHESPAGNTWHISYPRVIALADTNYSIAEINHQGFVARISALKGIGGFDTRLRFASDGKAMDQIVHSWRFKLSDQVITKFVIGGRSSSNYSKVLREIDSYRPLPSDMKNRKLVTAIKVLKNSLRMKVFHMSIHFPRIEDWILRVRKFL